MKVTIFKNMKGLVHGSDPKRIGCERAGTLKIGNTVITISPGEDVIMPLLFNGCSGDYAATFTTKSGVVYDLGKVEVREGRIKSPPPVTVELMELRLRLDAVEEKAEELSNIFDTDSLNFLIK